MNSSQKTFYTGKIELPDTHTTYYWNICPAFPALQNILTAIDAIHPGVKQAFFQGKGSALEIKTPAYTPLALLSTPIGEVWKKYNITHSIEIQSIGNNGVQTLVLGQNGFPIGYNDENGYALMVLEGSAHGVYCNPQNKRYVVSHALYFERIMRHYYLVPAQKGDVIIHE